MSTKTLSTHDREHIASLLLILFSLILAPIQFANANPCVDCGELRALEAKFASVKRSTKIQDQFAVVQKISAALKRIKTDGGELSPEQASLVISVLHLVDDENYRLEILEHNVGFFRDNRDLFAKELTPKTDRDSKQILRDIDSILVWDKYGQAPPREVMKSLGEVRDKAPRAK